jgi:hypothetical protein
MRAEVRSELAGQATGARLVVDPGAVDVRGDLRVDFTR